ncbi:uncharacterized protein EV154DRAFT_501684 [Mucor mucedo]|uniref:uncharacterized protein n=1 Tax=Mucor mucedo TaxID=29922 RepID=UPI00221FB210|nr:uncharacterized protein EV154DRAFT_501684 [Mucor mucedo]KAI7893331.1 hypothetical protein EV154DRAFT_501684 [Mucor mucedo]
MDQHVTTAEVPYYTSTQSVIPTPSSSSNLLFQPQEPQYHVQGYPPPQQQQQHQQQQTQYVMAPYNAMETQPMMNTGQYQSIDFFYETPQPDYTNTSAPNYQIPTSTRPTERSTSTTQSSVDEDYVQNLANELQHTKQLLSQYQLRTEQLMSLVEKQTLKINELREQLAENKKG